MRMYSPNQLSELKFRLLKPETSSELIRELALSLLDEVVRLSTFTEEYSSKVSKKLDGLEQDMLNLEKENDRLRKINVSTYFERDACIGLIARMALLNGIKVGTGKFTDGGQSQNRVVIDLPSGQVSWEYLESEAHLFESLPPYNGAIENQTESVTYTRVMNPNIDF